MEDTINSNEIPVVSTVVPAGTIDSNLAPTEEEQVLSSLNEEPTTTHVEQQDPIVETCDIKPNLNTLVTMDFVNKWKDFYLREGHTFPSTMSYYSFIKNFVTKKGIVINQKNVTKFRNNSKSGVCSAALKNFFNYLVIELSFPQDLLIIRFGKNNTKKKKEITTNYLQPLEVKAIIDKMQEEKLSLKVS